MAENQVPNQASTKLSFLHYDEDDQKLGSPASPQEWQRDGQTFVDQPGPLGSWTLLDCPNRLAGRYDPSVPNTLLEDVLRGSHYSLYVGIDSFTLQPVFAHAAVCPTGRKTVKYMTMPDMKDCDHNHRVLHEYFLTLDAESFTEDVVLGDKETLDSIGKDTVHQAVLSQISRLNRGDPIEPLQDPDHRDDLPFYWPLQTDYRRAEFYCLRLPCLTKAVLTPKLFEVAMEIQQALSGDNIHLNEIIMAIFVWCDHEKDPRRLTEGYIVERGRKYDYAPRQRLLNFVAMWPHYLRFHENHRLGEYIHPLRFVEAASGRVRGVEVPTPFHGAIDHRWEQTVLREVALSGLGEEKLWKYVMPCFLYKSLLKQPAGDNEHTLLLQELWELLALPDINMIGHPAYPVGHSLTTKIITPLPWNDAALDQSAHWEEGKEFITFTRKVVSDDETPDSYGAFNFIRLISGDRLPVAGPPRPLEPTDDPSVYEVAEGDSEEEGELHPAKTLKTLSFGEELAWRKQAWEIRLAIAVESGISAQQFTVDELGVLTWPGIEACVAARLKRGSSGITVTDGHGARSVLP